MKRSDLGEVKKNLNIFLTQITELVSRESHE